MSKINNIFHDECSLAVNRMLECSAERNLSKTYDPSHSFRCDPKNIDITASIDDWKHEYQMNHSKKDPGSYHDGTSDEGTALLKFRNGSINSDASTILSESRTINETSEVTDIYRSIMTQKWDNTIEISAINPIQVKTWIVKDKLSSDTDDNQRFLPIHSACAKTSVPASVIASLLTAYPQSSSEIDGKGMTPLHYACSHHASSTIISMLLCTNPSAASVIEPQDGRMPIHQACLWAGAGMGTSTLNKEMESILSMLSVIYPPSMKHRDKDGSTPLELLEIARKEDTEDCKSADNIELMAWYDSLIRCLKPTSLAVDMIGNSSDSKVADAQSYNVDTPRCNEQASVVQAEHFDKNAEISMISFRNEIKVKKYEMRIKFLETALEKYEKNITEQHSTIQLIEQHLVESRNEKHESLDELEDRINDINSQFQTEANDYERQICELRHRLRDHKQVDTLEKRLRKNQDDQCQTILECETKTNGLELQLKDNSRDYNIVIEALNAEIGRMKEDEKEVIHRLADEQEEQYEIIDTMNYEVSQLKSNRVVRERELKGVKKSLQDTSASAVAETKKMSTKMKNMEINMKNIVQMNMKLSKTIETMKRDAANKERENTLRALSAENSSVTSIPIMKSSIQKSRKRDTSLSSISRVAHAK